MGKRWANEPPYPRSQAEADAYCARFVDVMRSCLGERLLCVLLCGSWARGEAHPPQSDLDLTVVVDTVDDAATDALARSWSEATLAPANVYGSDEVPAMARDGWEMYTVNARVLWGQNPFAPPTRDDYAKDVARMAESIARTGRALALYGWLTTQERTSLCDSLLDKTLPWALGYLVAFRTGVCPTTEADLALALARTPEAALVDWLHGVKQADCSAQHGAIGRALSLAARDWLREVLPQRRAHQS